MMSTIKYTEEIEQINEIPLIVPAIPIKKTRTCYLCNVTYDLDVFCKSNRSKRCGKCLYQKKKSYMVQYYKDNREKIIQRELDKYNTKMANRGPKKPVGRKRDPSLVNLDLINEKNIENIIISNSEK